MIGRLGPVIDDHRRRLVAQPEERPRDDELELGMTLEIRPQARAFGGAFGGVLIDLVGHLDVADGISEALRKIDVANADGAAFRFVGLEQRFSALALHDSGKLPAEIDRVRRRPCSCPCRPSA